MRRNTITCAILFLLVCVECRAQNNNVKDTLAPLVTDTFSYSRYRWLSQDLAITKLSPFRTYTIGAPAFKVWNLRLRTDWTEEIFFLSDIRPNASQEEYKALLRNNLGFPYDPMNPYGLNNGADGLLTGSLNLLLMQFFPCK